MCIGQEFTDPFDDDILTDEDNLCTSSDVDSDSEDELDPLQSGDGVEGTDAKEY